MRYRPDIDGLRGIAVLSVIGFHVFPDWVRGGYVGVDVFFVISGYLISGLILDGLEHGRFTFANFYARRIKRIFPAVIVLLSACYVWGWFYLLADEYQQFGRHMAGSAAFVANFVLWRDIWYFDPASERQPLLHLWSLGIEEQFYLVCPLLLYLAWKRRLNLLWPTGIILVASYLGNAHEIRQTPRRLSTLPDASGSWRWAQRWLPQRRAARWKDRAPVARAIHVRRRHRSSGRIDSGARSGQSRARPASGAADDRSGAHHRCRS